MDLLLETPSWSLQIDVKSYPFYTLAFECCFLASLKASWQIFGPVWSSPQGIEVAWCLDCSRTFRLLRERGLNTFWTSLGKDSGSFPWQQYLNCWGMRYAYIEVCTNQYLSMCLLVIVAVYLLASLMYNQFSPLRTTIRICSRICLRNLSSVSRESSAREARAKILVYIYT